MDKLFVGERVAIGKDWEDRTRRCLNTHYSGFGYDLKESSFYEDCKEKTDCWQVSKSGKLLRSAIKVRLNKDGKLEDKKTDILIALFDPFYGVDDPNTVKGRDMLFEYFMYISVANGDIRVASGKVIHKIGDDLWGEFLGKAKDLQPESKGWGAKLVMKSEIHPGCQIWLHYDASSRKPKLLGFIPPSILKVDKEIKIHKFIED